MDDDRTGLSRRALLKGLGALGAGVALTACSSSKSSGGANANGATTVPPGTTTLPTPTTLPGPLRKPGTRPNPTLPEGVDTIPEIEHVVVVMMENHSFDDHFGMLGRGDGFELDANGRPLDANPDGKGKLVRSFHMPSTCQLHALPGQDWVRSHTSWANGRNDGFVKASTAVAMGYWDESDLPFYYALGKTFPLCDRWFCSTLAQTYPNRRFLLAGTAAGIVSTTDAGLGAPPPPNGTIMDRLHAHDISWRNYYTDLPGTFVILKTSTDYPDNVSKMDQFYKDAAAGKLPSVSFVDPHFGEQSEENPQDIRAGEAFAARVVNAVFQGPAWPKTLLIWTYDEHGGYYDHVAPPRAIRPDNIKPGVDVPVSAYDYDYYGFRVPSVIVSPYARRDYVSHVVHDQTSILKFIETKWNLGAMTYRDANADDLLDTLDLRAPPAFREPPTLAAAGATGTCTPGTVGGPIAPADAVVPASQASSLRIGATA